MAEYPLAVSVHRTAGDTLEARLLLDGKPVTEVFRTPRGDETERTFAARMLPVLLRKLELRGSQ